MEPTHPSPRIAEAAYASSVLGSERHFVVVKPHNGDPDAPILYLLHGRGRNRRSLVDDPICRENLLKSECWIILPDGDDGWYINSSKGQYSSIMDEIIRVAEDRCALSPPAHRRAIAGWSMGGYGAVRYAEAHPQSFGVVVSIIGLLDFPRPETLPVGQNYPVPTEYFGTDPVEWANLNPIHNIAVLRGKRLLLITATDAFDRTMNERFSGALTNAAIPHEFRVLTGGHTFDVIRSALPMVFDFVHRAIR